MKIIFVSNITPLQDDATSTDIMTYNIIDGISKVANEIELIAINSKATYEVKQKIEECYNKITSKIKLVKGRVGKNNGKYTYLIKLYKGLFQYSYKKAAQEISKDINNDTIIISHAPALESIFLCRCIKKYNKSIRWIQFWSDPIALSGINPEDFGFKRYPYYWLEKQCLRYADKIVYGTKILYSFQRIMFKKMQSKMDYIDIPYIVYKTNNEHLNQTDIIYNDLLYAGNFFKYTRNIIPLYEAIKELNGAKKLQIYGKGDQYTNSEYIIYNNRISPIEIENVISKYKNIICLMNSKCIQIPGKTFYDINTNKNILVIVDGIHKKEISEYLKSYNRFIIVDNTKESIIKGIKSLNAKKDGYNLEKIKELYSPEKIARKLIK